MVTEWQNPYADLPGTPSDQTPDIVAAGSSNISTLFVSMAERHPEGRDADYLRWHTLDHRPEQQRLASLRTSLRLVSTPDCRDARMITSPALDAVDHVMTYFFSELAGLHAFARLSVALRDAGRSPFILNPVQRGVYALQQQQVSALVTVGAELLPWVPVTGVYLLVEQGEALDGSALLEVPGVIGVFSAYSQTSDYASVAEGQTITYCFLQDEPVTVAEKMTKPLTQRWQNSRLTPLLAAPFYTVTPFAWDRYLP